MDFHGSIRVGEAVQYLSPRLGSDSHTLRFRMTGQHNPQAGESFVSVDRAEIYTN